MFFDLHVDTLSLPSPNFHRPALFSPCGECKVFALFGDDRSTRYAAFLALFEQYERFCAAIKSEELFPVFCRSDLSFPAKRKGILAIEGANALLFDARLLPLWFSRGVRVISPCWRENELSAGWNSAVDFGLTERGRTFVKKAAEIGYILDVSHLSENAAAETVELSGGRLLASHSNFAALSSHPRNLSDRNARAIARSGGVVGLNLFPPFLGGKEDLSELLRHAAYGLEQFGEDFLAVGSDFDGTDGRYPTDLDETRPFSEQIFALFTREFGERTARKICGENAVRFLSFALPLEKK